MLILQHVHTLNVNFNPVVPFTRECIGYLRLKCRIYVMLIIFEKVLLLIPPCGLSFNTIYIIWTHMHGFTNEPISHCNIVIVVSLYSGKNSLTR